MNEKGSSVAPARLRRTEATEPTPNSDHCRPLVGRSGLEFYHFLAVATKWENSVQQNSNIDRLPVDLEKSDLATLTISKSRE
ncbi:29577_t:CDS:2, partial [Racocetra persica]